MAGNNLRGDFKVFGKTLMPVAFSQNKNKSGCAICALTNYSAYTIPRMDLNYQPQLLRNVSNLTFE